MRTRMLRGGAFAAMLVALLVPVRASADVAQAKKCASAAERGQELERAERFRDARDKFAECARNECPAEIVSDCRAWGARAEGKLATLTCLAIAPGGRPVQDAQLTIDGVVVADKLDGKPFTLEPGTHRVRIAQGPAVVEESVVLQPGERGRVLLAKLPDLHAREAPPPTTRPVPAGVYVFGGLGVLGVAGFTILAIHGTNELDRLRNECGPTCPDGDLDSAQRVLVLGDISLGVGVASLATAAVLFFTRPRVALSPQAGHVEARAGGFAVHF